MNRSKFAEQRARLIDLLWEFKRTVAPKESLEFDRLIHDPVYRLAAVDRYRGARSITIKQLANQISLLDPRADLGPEQKLVSFDKNPKAGVQEQLSQNVGNGFMIIAMAGLLGLLILLFVGHR